MSGAVLAIVLVVGILLTCTIGCFFIPSRKDPELPKALPAPGTTTYFEGDASAPTQARPMRSTRSLEHIPNPGPHATTMAQVWSASVSKNGSNTAMMWRRVLETKEKPESRIVDGKEVKFTTTQFRLSDSPDSISYSQADDQVAAIAAGLAGALALPASIGAPPKSLVDEAEAVNVDLDEVKAEAENESGSGSDDSSPQGAETEENKEVNQDDGPKVCIYAATQKDWMLSSHACFRLGVPVVTAYDTLGLDALAYALDLVSLEDESLVLQSL